MNNTPQKQRNPITWIPSVYFAMGIPFVALSLVSVIMLSDLGIDEAKITFWASLLTLPYTLKPIWRAISHQKGVCGNNSTLIRYMFHTDSILFTPTLLFFVCHSTYGYNRI